MNTRRLLVLILLLTGGGLAALAWFRPFATREKPRETVAKPSPRLPPSDPRLTYSTPYRNVRPEVKYVGDAACAPCHGTIVEDYHRHPMAQSIAAVHHARSVERYDAAAHNPFQYAGVQYRVEPRKDGLVHSETLIDATGRVLAGTTASIALVVGSGQNGRAYLVQRNDALFASPIAWYPRKQQWDLAPGYDKQNPHFGRPIGADCLFCHANAADPIPGATNRYRSPQLHAAAIGCERCHGPGELHVERREKSEAVTGLDDTIVNPARLAHDLREDVCQQCHLQGQQRVVRRGLNPFDFRPGLPAPLFYSDFIKSKRDGPVAFVGAVEQMTTSVCYQKSAAKVNRMGCISCHDPHRLPKPEAKIAYYRERCQNCHERNGCSLPLPARIEKNADNCVACHMPPTGSSINHTTITDHRIVRRRDSSRDAPKRNDTTAFSLVHFHRDRVDPHDPEAERDLAIATVQYADSLPSGDALRTMLEQVLPLLDAACARDETDLPAREARGNALWFLGRLDEALETYERVLRDHADREMTRYQAATLSLRLGRLESARDHAERAVALNPGRWEYRFTQARIQAQANDWRMSLGSCREAFQLNGLDPSIHRQVVLAHLRLGEKTQAQQAFETLLLLDPAHDADLRRWFTQQSR